MNRITYVKERFFHSFKLFDRVEMSERQTKTERRKNYEKEREKKFTDWKHIPCNVYSMDSFDSDGGCTATWSKRNKYWICGIQLLVSPFYRGKHGIYTITDWMGLVPVVICLSFAGIGLVQLIKRRSLFKVDTDIMILGVYFVIVFLAYAIFEIIPINYRPILIEGKMEASYPSSNTLLVLSVMPALIEQIQRRLSGITAKRIIKIVAIAFSAFMVIGRLVSGVHWFTDIVGGVLLSAGLFKLYKAAVMLALKEK